MKRIIIATTLSLTTVLLASCSPVDSVRPFNQRQAAALLKDNHTFKPAQQIIALKIPNRAHWQRIDVSYQTVGTPIMYIPIDESKNHWTQSIRTQIRSYERYPGINANKYFHDEKLFEQYYCANVTGKITQHQTDYDMFELQLSNCTNKPDQTQYGKIFNGKDAVYAIYYTWIASVSPSDDIKQAISHASLVANETSY